MTARYLIVLPRAADGCKNHLGVGEFSVVEVETELPPLVGEHEGQFGILQRPVMMGGPHRE